MQRDVSMIRAYVIAVLVLGAASCQLLDVAGKIYEQTDAENDDTIKVSEPGIMAVGAELDIKVEDACTDTTVRCEVDSIEVTSAQTLGVLKLVDFGADNVTISATEAGKGQVGITATLDGSTDSKWMDVMAEPVERITLFPNCVGEFGRWIAAGERITLSYTLRGASGDLVGRLELPLETALTPISFDTPGKATYEAPLEPGIVSLTWSGGMVTNLDLEVFSPDQAELTLVPPTPATGSTVRVELEERVAGIRPCVETHAPVTFHTETPDVCRFWSGDGMSDEQNVGSSVLLSVVAAGTCTLSAVRKSGGTAIMQSFEVTL